MFASSATADGGRIAYDCAHGADPLALDRSGRFDLTGTQTPEHGGPVREDEKSESGPARYVGRLDGGRMTLTVTLTATGERRIDCTTSGGFVRLRRRVSVRQTTDLGSFVSTQR